MKESAMKKLALALPLSFAAGMAVLTGCASTSEPTTAADVMRGHASDQQAEVDQQNQLAEDWEEGKDLVSEGQRDVENGTTKVRKAEENIREGEEQIAEGRNKIQEGREKMRNAKQGFRQANPDADLQTSY